MRNINFQNFLEKEKNSEGRNGQQGLQELELEEAKFTECENEENSKSEIFSEELNKIKYLLGQINSNISYYDKFVITLKISNILKNSNVNNKINLLKILENRRHVNKFENLNSQGNGNLNKFPKQQPQIKGKYFIFSHFSLKTLFLII